MKSLILALSLFANIAWAQESGLSSTLENRKGLAALKKEQPAQAQTHFLEALSKNPLDPYLQFNLGYSLEKMDQIEKAKSAYETAAKLGKDEELLFAANYNRGVLFQKEKKIPEALKAYQEALKYNPDSKETKVNIELLTADQQGKGEGENKDQKQDGDKGSDKKDQQSEGQDQKDPKDDKDQQGKQDQPKQYGKSKPQPKPFKSEELTQGDVNKILGEIKQQEQKIRAEFNKKDVKDQPKYKDW